MTTIDDELAELAERTPPNDVLAEQSVLGSMLWSAEAVAEMAGTLQPQDFYRPAHQTVFRAMLDLYGHGEPVTIVTVVDHLLKTEKIGRIGGPAYLHTLMESTVTAVNAGFYARIVARMALKRRVIAAGQQIVQAGWSPSVDVDEMTSIVHAAVETIEAPETDTTWSPLDHVMASVLSRYAEALGDGGPQGVKWGFYDVDKVMPPLVPGDFAVIVAWSGGGKSVIAANLALGAAVDQGFPSLLHSLEMTRIEVGQRYAAKTGSITLTRIIQGDLSPAEEDHLEHAVEKVTGAPLIIDEGETLTLSRLRASIRKHRPYLVVVDQIPIMLAEDTRVSREQQLTGIAYGLKRMAKAEGVAIVACAQLNSAPMSRSNKKPTLEDIRESRAIAHAANSVVALYDPTEGEKEGPRAGEYEWVILKNRQGPKDTLVLAQQFHYSRLMDVAR